MRCLPRLLVTLVAGLLTACAATPTGASLDDAAPLDTDSGGSDFDLDGSGPTERDAPEDAVADGDTSTDASGDAPGDAEADGAADPDGATDGTGDAGADATPTCEAAPSDDPLLLRTTLGPFRGQREDGARVWRGIRYAVPPLGDLRFRPPTTPECAALEREALAFGDECVQRNDRGQRVGSEDCLTLNVWLPDADPPEDGWPVLFWIHGGGNIQGSSRVPLLPIGDAPAIYDGRRLAAEGPAIIVTINYRLGPFGYLALPDLAAETVEGTTGNYGLLDQIAALRWVHANASALGADLSRVLIFGESAGGVNTCTLLASPLSSGLFTRAAIQSGGCPSTPLSLASLAHAERVSAGTCGTRGDRVGCLRSLSADVLLRELGGTISIGSPGVGAAGSYGPVIDGHVLDEPQLEAVARGAGVPVLVGSNAEELAELISVEVGDDDALRAVIEAAYPFLDAEAVDALLAEYNGARYGSAQLALEMLLADARFHCSALSIAAAVVEGGQPAYRYWFSRQYPARDGPKPAAHAAELFYVFGTVNDIPLVGAPAADAALSEAMRAAWLRFAATGDPNPTEPAWPASGAGQLLELTDPIGVIDDPRASQCALLESLLGGG